MSAGTRYSASHPILAIRSCFNLEGYSVGVVLRFVGFGPPLTSDIFPSPGVLVAHGFGATVCRRRMLAVWSPSYRVLSSATQAELPCHPQPARRPPHFLFSCYRRSSPLPRKQDFA